MPDKDGKLTQEESTKAIQWLNAKAPKILCAICGHNSWTIAEHYVHPPIFRGGALLIGGLAYPQIMLTCSNCTHTVLFNAILMGVYPKGEKPKEAEAAKPEEEPKTDEPKPEPPRENAGGR